MSWDLGEEVYEKDHKGSIQNESSLIKCLEILNKTNNTNNNSQIENSQGKSPTMNQSNWKGALQKPLSEEQSPTKC